MHLCEMVISIFKYVLHKQEKINWIIDFSIGSSGDILDDGDQP
jgi:hypothetical protein